MPSAEPASLKAFLPTIPIFGGLGEETLERVVAMLKPESAGIGTTICHEGEPGKSMHIVLEGEVMVYRAGPQGTLIKLVRLGPGEFFGEMTLIDPQPRSNTVIVQRPSVLLTLTNRDLVQLYREDVHGYVMVLQNICRELSRRLRKADARICEIAVETDDSERTQIGSSVWTVPRKT